MRCVLSRLSSCNDQCCKSNSAQNERCVRFSFLIGSHQRILDIVRYYARKGSLIFFEPSGGGDPRLFQEALRLTHVLKYSHQRVRSFTDLLTKWFPPLQIETLGEDGLRYRCNLPGMPSSGWRLMGSFEVPVFKDSAGSGDWCSAGIISTIGANGVEGLSSLSLDDLTHALRYGQALAAWNCGLEGARGGINCQERIQKVDLWDSFRANKQASDNVAKQ